MRGGSACDGRYFGGVRSLAPEAGAVCGSSARTDLCGGRGVIPVPTASAGSDTHLCLTDRTRCLSVSEAKANSCSRQIAAHLHRKWFVYEHLDQSADEHAARRVPDADSSDLASVSWGIEHRQKELSFRLGCDRKASVRWRHRNSLSDLLAWGVCTSELAHEDFGSRNGYSSFAQ